MKKKYDKPVIEVLSYVQKDAIATCGAWLVALYGDGCRTYDYTAEGNAACDPDMAYSK